MIGWLIDFSRAWSLTRAGTHLAGAIVLLVAIPVRAAPDPQGVWRGTIGKSDIVACLDLKGRSAYYYRRHGKEITLVETIAHTWQESAGELTGAWTIKAIAGDQLTGVWHSLGHVGKFDESAPDLPIVMTRVEAGAEPCKSDAYRQYLATAASPKLDYAPPVSEQFAMLPNGHSIASSAGRAYYVAADGGLWAWGLNSDSRYFNGMLYPYDIVLGDGTAVARNKPIQIGRDFVSVATGADHALGLKKDGSLWVWGVNTSGQLGITAPSGAPRPTLMGKGYREIAASGQRSFAIKEDGTLWAWGLNEGGLGDGTTINRLHEVEIGSDFISISAGIGAVAIKRDGSLWTWGEQRSSTGERPHRIGSGFKQAEAISHNVGYVGLTTDGEVWTWGPGAIDRGCCFARVMASGDKYFGIRSDGTLWTWNAGSEKIGADFADIIDAAYSTSIAVKTDGTLWTWSERYASPLLGDGIDRSPLVAHSVGTQFKQIAAGGSRAAAIQADGSLWVWGRQNNSNVPSKYHDARQQLPGQFKQVAMGTNDVLALASDGTIWTDWTGFPGGACKNVVSLGDGSPANKRPAQGKNALGSDLGDGDPFHLVLPLDLNHDFVKVAAGGSQLAGLRSDGTLWSWGWNRVSPSHIQCAPIKVGDDFTDVAISDAHTVALKRDGTLWTWGFNGSGELGDGTTTDRSEAKRVAGTGYTQIVAGAGYTLALQSDGTVWGMGEIAPTYLGKPGPGHPPEPLGREFVRIAASADAKNWFAIDKNGTLWAWGDNTSGQLGDGTQLTRDQLVRVGYDYVNVAAGSGFTIGLKPDGSVWTWGIAGASGQRVAELGMGAMRRIASGVAIGSSTDLQRAPAKVGFSVPNTITTSPWDGLPPENYVTQGGLVWMPVTFEMPWQSANDYCTTTTLKGRPDWRLPTQAELNALHASGEVNGKGWRSFDRIQVWSSTLLDQHHIGVNLQTGKSEISGDLVTCVHAM